VSADAHGRARARRRGGRYFVLELDDVLLLPLGDVDDVLPDGDVVVVSVERDVDPLDVVPGDADGLVRFGELPTRSVSVRLHATVIPPASARAQRPDSNFFMADDPPLWGLCFDPSP
jgi:hypothetical protein